MASLDVIERAHQELGLPYAEVARAVSADESTLHRWRAGQTTPSPVFIRRLAALGTFLDALAHAYPDGTREAWLTAPLAGFGGASPRDLLTLGRVEVLTGLLAARAVQAPRSARQSAPLAPGAGTLAAKVP